MNRFAKASLLLCFFGICAAALVISHRSREGGPAPVPRELFSVVQAQLVAFRADDFRSAYLHAASGVQQKFSVSQFESLARRDYQMMATAQRVEFGDVTLREGKAIVQVLFFAGDGSVRVVAYSMVQEQQLWKIAGVTELEHYWPNERLKGRHV